MLPLLGQQHAVDLQPPFGPAKALVSPDRRQGLFGSEDGRQLWAEDRRTHERRPVLNVTIRTLTLAWSPDSSAFIVNDRVVSDVEYAYIYDVKTLQRLDLRSLIISADPATTPFLPGTNTAPHSYCHAIRWLDAHRAELQLHGHTAGVRQGNRIRPADCFDFRYSVGRDGVVKKLSEHVSPVTAAGCHGE